MEDLLDQLRDSRLAQTPKWQREININDLSAHNKAHAAYDHLRWRLNWGLPGSIVLMLVVAALAPYYVHSLPYFVCYAVVQLITIVRVMIAVQMYIAIRHLDPTRPVAEVNAYADRMTLLQRFNHHYTLYIKLPLTICLGPLFGPPLGFDFFCYKWVLYLWIVLCVVLLSLTARVVADSVKENLAVTVVLEDDVQKADAEQVQMELKSRCYVGSIDYISREQALQEQIESMGIDPTDFLGANPFSTACECSGVLYHLLH